MGYRVIWCGFGGPSGQAGYVITLNSLISLTYHHSFGNMCAYPGLGPPAGLRTVFIALGLLNAALSVSCFLAGNSQIGEAWQIRTHWRTGPRRYGYCLSRP